MKSWLVLALAAGTIAAASPAKAEYEVIAQTNVEYAQHDGVKLVADLYQPKGLAKAPAVIAVHGGGWQNGSRASYRYWGPYLAKNGYVVLSIDYRLGKAGTYPGSVYDVKAAIQFVRAKAADLGVDPDRIGLMGDSAGGHLVALVAVAGAEPQFSSAYRDDAWAATPTNVKAVVGFYGVYDMLAQWEHDQIARPRDQITEKFLGSAPMMNRKVFFESSPISYATVDKNTTRFLLVHGTNDDIVDPATQSTAFLTALKQAQFVARTVVIPGAGHFWLSEPLAPGSFGAYAGPKVLLFLQAWL